MTRLFIEVRNGVVVDHPVSQENLEAIYNGFDPDSPSDPFLEFFESNEKLGAYEVSDSHEYVITDRGVERRLVIRPMTSEEKAKRIEYLMQFKPAIGDYYFDEKMAKWRPNLNQPGSPPDVIG